MNEPYYISKYSGEEIDAAIERILDPGNFSATLTVTTRPGADVTATSGAWSFFATADNDGVAVLTITSPRTYAVVVTLGSSTDSGSISIIANGGQYTIAIFPAVASLNDASWAEISAIAASGKAADYWKLGDTKTIAIKGSIGALYADISVEAMIIGFNHNAELEGNNRIHFQIGKMGGIDIALVDTQYGSTGSASAFRMNASATTRNGWEGSQMRSRIMGGNPDDPGENSLLAALPHDLAAVMKPCVKYTENIGESPGSESSVTATSDYLFLLSEFENYGYRDVGSKYEEAYQKQYDYYRAGNAMTRRKHLDASANARIWTRSPGVSWDTGFKTYFCNIPTGVTSEGTTLFLNANISSGIAPGFCV